MANSNPFSLSGQTVLALSQDINSLCLVKECRELEEGFGTHFTWRGARSIRSRRTSEQPSMIATCSRTQQSALGRHPSSLKWQTGSAGASCGTWQWTLVSRVTEGCNVLAGQSAITAVETIPAPVAMLLLSAQHSSNTFWTATVPNTSWITTSPKRA